LDPMRDYGEGTSSKEKMDVLDLIIDVLRTHEAMLDVLAGRLENLCYRLEAVSQDDDFQSTGEIDAKISEERISIIQDG
jgi:hypothetical protein